MKRGFTLIELLVVIVILGFLVTIAAGSFMSSQKKSRDSKRKNDFRQVSLALEAYYNDKGRYPAADAQSRIAGCAPTGVATCQWGEVFQADTGGMIYMLKLPVESVTTQTYRYVTDANGTWYQLYGRLENVLDNDIPKNVADQSRIFSDLNCASGITPIYCNYGVSSANRAVETGHTVSYE